MRSTRSQRRAAAGLLLLLALGGAAAQQGATPPGTQECSKSVKPSAVGTVKAGVVNDTAVQLVWLPPDSEGCFTSFKVTGKAVGGAALPSQTADSSLSAAFGGLKPGTTYEFTVTPSGPAGAGPPAAARAALPPAFLDVRPDAPEAFEATAVSDSSAKLTWVTPAGNPKVDTYLIKAVPVNATGFPLEGGKNRSFSAAGAARSAVVTGLSPSSFYVFEIVATSGKGSSPEPALSFYRAPAPGGTLPAAPRGIKAAQAGSGEVALDWQPPAGSQPDFYEIGITEVDKSGAPLSATNTIPFANTTALVRDLTPGSTYQFDVRSFSTSYDGGKSAKIVYTVPTSYKPPAAIAVPPPGLVATVYGQQVQLLWSPSAGAEYYVVSIYDAYSGRPLGIQYQTRSPSININGLPVGQALQIVVQAVGGGYYSEPATATVEIPTPMGYYTADYSPYYGYNPYMPYWYSSYYPTGWYNAWFPGKWALFGVAAALNPFNNFWGPGWWINRPYPINPLWNLNPLHPFRPTYWNGGWGWGGAAIGAGVGFGVGLGVGAGLGALARPRPVARPGGVIPGQRPLPTTRPTPIPGVVRPSIPTTRPATGIPTTRPAVPTTRPAMPGAGGAGTLKPAPGLVDGAGRPGVPTTRPATGIPTTRPATGIPTTLPATGFPTTRPATGIPTTRPATGIPTTRPATGMPMTRPATSMPMTRPATTMPMTRPAPMPSYGGGFGGAAMPAMPMARPAMPPMQLNRGFGGGGGHARGRL